MAGQCKTCEHWSPYEDGHNGGFCAELGRWGMNPALREDPKDWLVCCKHYEHDIETGPEFGCVHHVPDPDKSGCAPGV